MCTNKLSIDWLIGVRVSSIVNEVIRPISNLLIFFFLQKLLSVKKHSQAKINQQNKIKKIPNNKGNIFMSEKTSERVKSVYFLSQNLSVKKINRFEIVLITTFTMLLLKTFSWDFIYANFNKAGHQKCIKQKGEEFSI